jgi:hypothetical protein
MKTYNSTLRILIIALFLTTFSITDGTASTPNEGPKFEFKAKNNRIQLDTIYISDMDDEVNLEVEFENTGDAPLIVRKVEGCCGTRVVEWTQRPLRPGETGTIKVEFRVELRPHLISRTIEATTNDPEGIKKLQIKSVVTDKDKGEIDLM